MAWKRSEDQRNPNIQISDLTTDAVEAGHLGNDARCGGLMVCVLDSRLSGPGLSLVAGALHGRVLKPETTKRNHRNETSETKPPKQPKRPK